MKQRVINIDLFSLKGLGLIEESAVEDHETTINYLLNTALSKIAFFPFAYIMDKWRWDVFDGSVSPDDYNCHWWKLRYLVHQLLASYFNAL